MAILGKLFGKSGSGKASFSTDQDSARPFLSSVPGRSAAEQDAVRQHMEAELEAQRAARAAQPQA